MALGLQSNFAYGVISGGLQGRVDVDLYRAGLSAGHNVIIDLFGGVRKRPPLRATPYTGVRITEGTLIQFRFSANDSALWQLQPAGVREHIKFVNDRVDVGDHYSFIVEPVETLNQPGGVSRLLYTQTGDDVLVTNRTISPFIIRRSVVTVGEYSLPELEKVEVSDSLTTAISYFGNPATITQFQQRFIMAGSDASPGSLLASRVGNFNSFEATIPITEADPVQATLVSKSIDRIVQAATLKRLLLFTEGGEWEVTGQLTPTNIGISDISRWGCSDVPVVEAQNFVLFVPPDKKSVRAMELNEYDNLKSRDLTLFARDIFRNRVVRNMAHAGRYLIVVFTDGTAAVCTYDGEAGIPAWTTMDTNLGTLEEVLTLPVEGIDRFFFVVTHDRTEERYLVDFEPDEDEGPYCDHLDVLSASDVAAGRIDVEVLAGLEGTFGLYSSLGHKVATIQSTLAPNTRRPRLALPENIDLRNPDSFIVGMPYDSYIETLNLDETTEGRSFGKRQSVARVRVQVRDTRGLMLGPDSSKMVAVKMRQLEGHGEGVEPFTGFLRVPIPRSWESNGKVRIESVDPYRMEILAVIPDTQLGDT